MRQACPPEVPSSEKRLKKMQLLVKKQLEIVEKCKRQTEEAEQQLLDMVMQGVAAEHAFSWRKKQGDEHPTFQELYFSWTDENDLKWTAGAVLPFFGHRATRFRT